MPSVRTLRKVLEATDGEPISTRLHNAMFSELDTLPDDSGDMVCEAYRAICLTGAYLEAERGKHNEWEFECEELVVATIGLRDLIAALTLLRLKKKK